MSTNQKDPDSSASPVDVSRVCTSMDAPWDERNDRLTDVLRWSAEKPTKAKAEIRHLLEQGININARDGNRWRALRLAAYFQAPMSIRNMLAYASREGSAPVSTTSGTVVLHVRSVDSVPDDRARCEQCERDVAAIFCCPERSLGHCPFVEKWSRNVFAEPSRWVVVVACVLVIGVTFGKSMWVAWVTLAFLAITHVFFETIREALLYNPQAQVGLERTTVAGLEWSYRWSWEVRLPVRFEPTPPLAYPSSISSICSRASISGIRASNVPAVTIFRAALIELLTKQYIEASFCRSYAVTRAEPAPTVVDSYVVLVKRHMEGFKNLGELEKRILLAVTHCSVLSVLKNSTEGCHLYDVVRAVYKEDQSNPAAWVAELVASDAIERGIGQINKKWSTMKIVWSPINLSRLRDEEKIAQSLSEQLYEMHTEFSRVLDIQISRAISSRTAESGGGGGG